MVAEKPTEEDFKKIVIEELREDGVMGEIDEGLLKSLIKLAKSKYNTSKEIQKLAKSVSRHKRTTD
jgi:hypothetical protein